MSRQRALRVVGLAMLAISVLLGCSGDCEWHASVRTWVDTNENGEWDQDEQPLPNVKCMVQGYLFGPAEAISNEKGEAHIQALVAGCRRKSPVFVYVFPPSGYRASFRTLKPTPDADEPTFEFGFVPVNE